MKVFFLKYIIDDGDFEKMENELEEKNEFTFAIPEQYEARVFKIFKQKIFINLKVIFNIILNKCILH